MTHITLAQAKQLKKGQILHCTYERPCSETIGPRGGSKKTDITKVRVSGQVQVWKTRPDRVIVPIQHGLYVHGYINEGNLQDFHFPEDCPLALREAVDSLDESSPMSLEDWKKVQSIESTDLPKIQTPFQNPGVLEEYVTPPASGTGSFTPGMKVSNFLIQSANAPQMKCPDGWIEVLDECIPDSSGEPLGRR